MGLGRRRKKNLSGTHQRETSRKEVYTGRAAVSGIVTTAELSGSPPFLCEEFPPLWLSLSLSRRWEFSIFFFFDGAFYHLDMYAHFDRRVRPEKKKRSCCPLGYLFDWNNRGRRVLSIDSRPNNLGTSQSNGMKSAAFHSTDRPPLRPTDSFLGCT